MKASGFELTDSTYRNGENKVIFRTYIFFSFFQSYQYRYSVVSHKKFTLYSIMATQYNVQMPKNQTTNLEDPIVGTYLADRYLLAKNPFYEG